MPVVVSVVGASVVALVVVLLAQWAGKPAVMGDPEPAERWFVDRVARVRGARRFVRALDRHVWGGAMVGLAFVAVLGAAVLVGGILSAVDDDGGFARFDRAVAEWGSEHATPLSTDVLTFITHLGDTVLLVVLMTLVGVLVVWRQNGHRWSVLGFLLTVGVGVSLINNALKWIVARDRPDIDQLVGSGGSSFPSGHSAAAAACWAALALVVSSRMWLWRRRWVAAIAVAVAVLVAASRVMLGVHWLTDVIAGVVVGWTWFFLVALVFGGRLQRFGEPLERMAPDHQDHHDQDHHDHHDRHDHDDDDDRVDEPAQGVLT